MIRSEAPFRVSRGALLGTLGRMHKTEHCRRSLGTQGPAHFNETGYLLNLYFSFLAYINNNNRLPNLPTITYHQNHLDVAPRSAIADLAEKTPEKLFTFPDPRVPHIILPGSA